VVSGRWQSSRVQAIPPSATIALSDQVRRMRTAGRPVINLISGAPDFDTPGHIKAAAKAALDEDYIYTSYTESAGLPELREAIARKLTEENGIATGADDVLVTIGVKEGIHIAAQACLEPGDEVLLPTPAWVTYQAAIQLAGAAPVSVPMDWRNGFRPDIDALAARVTVRTRAILINTPHNPTGIVYRRPELEAIADLALRHDLLVLVDETLEHLIYDDSDHISIASLPGMNGRTVTFNGFSKAYCMTGWRLGYAVAPPRILQDMLKVHQHTVTCACAFVQKAAVTALTGPQYERHAIRERLRRRRDLLVGVLDGVPGLRCPMPQAGLFCFPNVVALGLSDDEFVALCLERVGVAVLGGANFGAGGEGHVRIAFGRRDEESLLEAAELVRGALGSVRHRSGGPLSGAAS
jgi:aspartate/methionine/tyrosine aminotransferase